MSVRPSLSVIITYHNEGSLLARALDSVWAQTFSGAVEIVLVDDASDARPDLRAEYRWPVRLVRSEKNIGAPAARNLGVAHSEGDLVCFLDADDVYLADRISSHVNFLEGHPDLVMVG